MLSLMEQVRDIQQMREILQEFLVLPPPPPQQQQKKQHQEEGG